MLAGMTDDDDDHDDIDFDFDAFLKNRRPALGFWAYRDKRVGEPNTAREILKEARFSVDRLTARPDGQDPPDCEGTVDGSHAGIEVTELVHQGSLERSLAGRTTWFPWRRQDFTEALQTIIDKKGGDGPRWQGGPYGLRLLVVHTDEPDLTSTIVSRFLEGQRFTSAFFSDVVLGLPYEPATERCPTFRLSLDRS
jgi:hypothetical protein